jgi:hypothetical protein
MFVGKLFSFLGLFLEGFLEEFFERLVLGFQNLDFGGNGINGGVLGNLFCEPESKKVMYHIHSYQTRVDKLQYQPGVFTFIFFMRVSKWVIAFWLSA